MAKRPQAGRTKTRLCPPLAPQQAADLYACLLADTLDSARAAAARLPCALFIAPAPAGAEPYFRELAPDFGLLPQGEGALGARLARVLGAAAAQGYGQAAAINSDSPALPPAWLAGAFARLDDPAVDVVLGPCADGGYYLIGWKRPYPPLVTGVQMSTPRVLADTLAAARAAGLRAALLPPWYDIDDADDLARLRVAGDAGPRTAVFLAGMP